MEQTTVTLLRNQGSDTMGAPVAETQVHASSLRVRVNKFADWIKTPHVMLSIILMLTLMYFVLSPFVQIVKTTFLTQRVDLRRIPGAREGDFTLFYWHRTIVSAMRKNLFFEPLRNTLVVTAGFTVLALTIGIVLSYLVARTDLPFKKFIASAAIVPYIIPSWPLALAWLTLTRSDAGSGGSPGMFQYLTGIALPEWVAYGPFPIIMLLSLKYYAYTYLLLSAAFSTLDSQLEESAVLHGANRLTIFRRIVLPIMIPALGSAFILTFSKGLGTFGIPSFLGVPRRYYTLSTILYSQMQNRRTAEGFIAAIAMVILALVLIYINSRIIGARKQFTTVSGKGTKRNLASLGKWRYPVAIAVIVFLLSASVLPMGLLLYQSLMARMGDYSLSNLTLHYWIGTDPTVREGHIGLLVNPRVWTAAKNTLMLGTLTGIGSALLGILLGYAISRGRGTKLALSLDQLSFLPFLIPDIAFGAIYLTMSARPMGPIPPLYGTFALLVLVSTVSRLPNATRSGTSSMMQVSMELEEAAYVHGSSWFNTFRRIMLPLTKNGFMAGFVLTFIGTMTALSLIILLYTPSTVILPVLTFEYANRELRQLSDGMSLLITLLVIVGTYVARKLTGTDLSQGFGGGN